MPLLGAAGSEQWSGIIPDLWPQLPDPLPWYLGRSAVLTWVTLLVAPALSEWPQAGRGQLGAGSWQLDAHVAAMLQSGMGAGGNDGPWGAELLCAFACPRCCLPACLPACLFACLPACLPAGPKTLGDVAVISVMKVVCSVMCVGSLVVLAVVLAVQGRRWALPLGLLTGCLGSLARARASLQDAAASTLNSVATCLR